MVVAPSADRAGSVPVTLPVVLTEPVARWARRTPDRLALADRARGVRLTYAALDDLAARWAALLLSRGIVAGDRVAVLSGNRAEVVALYVACGRIGAALVPLNWRMAAPELARIISDARPALAIGESRFAAVAAALAAVATSPPWADLDACAEGAARMAPWRTTEPDAPLVPERAALILYTSGSTGAPKGAILSHRQVLANAIATGAAWGLSAADTGPITTPFFHTGGWNVFAVPLWEVGGTVILVDGFDPAVFLDVLAEEACTVAFAVPTQFVMLVDAPQWGRSLPALRWFISGGAPCPLALIARVRQAGYRMREGFGMTEFGPNCFGITEAQSLAKPGSVGWPVPFAEMRLVDAGDRDVADGETGELWLRGPQLFSGYLFDEARTAEAFAPGGWLRTGDLASRDADGAYFIRGRRKQMFISGGENVYPQEVEAVITGLAGVAEAVVLGVSDEKWGEVGHAVVVPRRHAALDAEMLRAGTRALLAGYKVPRHWTIVAELPRIGSGKVDRAALAAVLRGGS